MKITQITQKDEYEKAWRKQEACILQSWSWGEVKSGSWVVKRYLINNYPVQIFIKTIPITGRKFGYVPRPFLNKSINNDLLDGIKQIADKDLSLSHLIVDPDLQYDHSIFNDNGFINSGITIQPNQTNIIKFNDISDPWMLMKGKYRRNIKKSKRNGCTVEVFNNGDEYIERFYKVMEVVFKRTNYIMYGIDYFKIVWKILAYDKLAKIYIATVNGEDVGAYFVAFDETYAYELYGGVTNEGRDVEAGYLLKWEAIKDAKMSGKTYYDHWGVSPYNEDGYSKIHELYNISRFKKGFGGEDVTYIHQQTIVFDKLSYLVYKMGLNLNKLILYIKKH